MIYRITVDYADTNTIGKIPNGRAIIHHDDGLLLEEMTRHGDTVTCMPLRVTTRP